MARGLGYVPLPVLVNAYNGQDPVFYLQHALLDRICWQWLDSQLSTCLTAITGNTSMFPSMDWSYTPATLEDTLTTYSVIPNAKIRELMDMRGKLLCHSYT